MQKPMRCIINNEGRNPYYAFSIKEVVIMILLLVDVQYSPFGVAKWNIIKALRLVEEFCKLVAEKMKGQEKGQMSRLLRGLRNSRTYILKARDRKTLCRRYYDLILSMEGLSTLPGFGMSNLFGDKLYGNPEKVSIMKTDNLLKKRKE